MRSALLTPSLYHLLLQSHKHREMVERSPAAACGAAICGCLADMVSQCTADSL